MIVAACQPEGGAGLVTRILSYVDCQAQAIGAGSFHAFAAPGSTLSLIISVLLTIFIALLGYRMLLGWTPDVSDGVIAAVKVGIVLMLAFSWPAYRTLVYDLFLKGPAELTGEIGRPAALPGATGGLMQRLDGADRGFIMLASLGPGTGAPAPIGEASLPGARQQAPSVFDPFALGGARVVFLTGAIGAIAGLRMIAALMLALGPIFVSFLLFAGTRDLFEGWLRVLGGAALGALGSAIVLGVELALIEPWLAQLIAWRSAGYSVPGAPVELFVVSIVFALALAAVVAASWRVTVGLGLPSAWRAFPAQLTGRLGGLASGVDVASPDARGSAGADRSRAAAIAEAVSAVQRRELVRSGSASGGPSSPISAGTVPAEATSRAPLGQSSRRLRNRVSQSANRRDQRQ